MRISHGNNLINQIVFHDNIKIIGDIINMLKKNFFPLLEFQNDIKIFDMDIKIIYENIIFLKKRCLPIIKFGHSIKMMNKHTKSLKENM